MNKQVVAILFLLILSATNAFTQDLQADLMNGQIIIEKVTLEELNQRKIDRLKSAQDSALISSSWQIEQFRNQNHADKAFGRDYEKFLKTLKKKGIRYEERAKADFENDVKNSHSSEQYFVYQDFTVYEDGKHLIIVTDVKLISPNRGLIYTGSWKRLEKKIK